MLLKIPLQLQYSHNAYNAEEVFLIAIVNYTAIEISY